MPPLPLPVPRSNSVGGADLEGGGRTPRFRQPITPRRPALKKAHSGGAAVNLQATAGSLHLPASGAAMGQQLAHNVARTMATVQVRASVGRCPMHRPLPASMQRTALHPGLSSCPLRGSFTPAAAVRAPAFTALQGMQDRRREAYLSQQAAEQAAMREYIKSKPQVRRLGMLQ